LSDVSYTETQHETTFNPMVLCTQLHEWLGDRSTSQAASCVRSCVTSVGE
jgi:hypothetical protein